MKRAGFTNRMAAVIVGILAVGLCMGFVLALLCIRTQFDGALVCFTVAFTPIGTALSIVLTKVVDKSKAENTTSDSHIGINYMKAEKAAERDDL